MAGTIRAVKIDELLGGDVSVERERLRRAAEAKRAQRRAERARKCATGTGGGVDPLMAAAAAMEEDLERARSRARIVEPGPRNTDVYLTCGRPEGEFDGRGQSRGGADCATRDLSDRAHGVKSTIGIIAARWVKDARPRRYPACCMTSRGVAHDSMFDDAYTLARELEEAGIELGARGRAAEAKDRALDRLSAGARSRLAGVVFR